MLYNKWINDYRPQGRSRSKQGIIRGEAALIIYTKIAKEYFITEVKMQIEYSKGDKYLIIACNFAMRSY